jgi:hypothetical protein
MAMPDPAKLDEVAAAIKELPSDQAEFFLKKLEVVLRRRKIQLTGYLVGLVLWVVAMLGALAYYGTYDGFTGWVFLIPFGVLGGVITLFGRWARKLPDPKPPA